MNTHDNITPGTITSAFKAIPGVAEGLKFWGCTYPYKIFKKTRFIFLTQQNLVVPAPKVTRKFSSNCACTPPTRPHFRHPCISNSQSKVLKREENILFTLPKSGRLATIKRLVCRLRFFNRGSQSNRARATNKVMRVRSVIFCDSFNKTIFKN